MSIYTKPYVYICTHKVTGQIYIGARCANKVPAHQDLGTYYFTSSKLVNPRFDEFDWEIIFEGSREEVFQLEAELIDEHWRQPYLLNKQNGGVKFNTVGKCHSEETKSKMSKSHKGENNPFYGKTHSEETKSKMSKSHKGENNPFYGKTLSESHKQKLRKPKSSKGKPKSEEHKSKISESNKHRIPWNKGKPRQIITCPHCGKQGGEGVMKRWHFNNCKHK